MVAPPRKSLSLGAILARNPGVVEKLPVSNRHKRILAQIGMCQTGAFGYHVYQCGEGDCGATHRAPRSCNSRYCPRCGYSAVLEWLDERELKLLPVPYFHTVFTLPPQLYPLLRDNPELLYNLLFASVKDTLLTFCRNELEGAIPQILLALHTWNSELGVHIHLHVLVSAGGYQVEQDRWIPSESPDFLFPVRAMGKVFRGKYLAALQKLWEKGLLDFHASANVPLKDKAAWAAFRDRLYKERWHVYADRPPGGPKQVLRYLGHYLRRTGFSDHRIKGFEDGNLTFECRDRKKRRSETGTFNRTLPLPDFLLLYLEHVLPRYFHRIRFAGLWSTKYTDLTDKAREAILRDATLSGVHDVPEEPAVPRPKPPCPTCKKPSLVYQRSVVLIPDLRWFFIGPSQQYATGPPGRARRVST